MSSNLLFVFCCFGSKKGLNLYWESNVSLILNCGNKSEEDKLKERTWLLNMSIVLSGQQQKELKMGSFDSSNNYLLVCEKIRLPTEIFSAIGEDLRLNIFFL